MHEWVTTTAVLGIHPWDSPSCYMVVVTRSCIVLQTCSPSSFGCINWFVTYKLVSRLVPIMLKILTIILYFFILNLEPIIPWHFPIILLILSCANYYETTTIIMWTGASIQESLSDTGSCRVFATVVEHCMCCINCECTLVCFSVWWWCTKVKSGC